MFSGKYTDNGTQVAPAVLTGVAQNRTETEMMTAGFSSKAMETPQNFISKPQKYLKFFCWAEN